MKLKHIRIKLRLILKKLVLDIRHTHLRDLRNLFLLYLKKLPDIIHLKNLVFFNSILSIIVLVMFTQRFAETDKLFREVAPDFGGIYREGEIGNVEKINPLFVQNNAEESANRLVFSGLTRVLPGDKVVGDLADSWQISDDGLTYTFKLKDNQKWHDGKSFTADDVIFTIGLIQNPDTRTSRTAIWRGVKIEKIDEKNLKFTLPNPYPNFLNTASEAILPKHLLEQINPKNIKVAEFNSKPVGTGPFKFSRFDQAGNEPEVIFKANKDFSLGKPYLEEVRLKSYETFDALYEGFVRKQIDSLTEIPYDKVAKINRVSGLLSVNSYLPRYKSLTMNLKNPILADKEIRRIISISLSRKSIIEKAIYGQGEAIYAPILPGQIGYDPKYRKDSYDQKSANEALDKAGWVKGADGIRTKDGKTLEFRLISTSDSEDIRASKEIAKELQDVGIKINLASSDPVLIQADYLRPRNFDLLFIGKNISLDPDLYSFLDSSQINDPGLNFSGFKDPAVDKFLEQIKKSKDTNFKETRYKQVQDVLGDQIPEVYLYNPIFTLAISKNVKGFEKGKISEPSDHLNDIYKWYLKEKKK